MKHLLLIFPIALTLSSFINNVYSNVFSDLSTNNFKLFCPSPQTFNKSIEKKEDLHDKRILNGWYNHPSGKNYNINLNIVNAEENEVYPPAIYHLSPTPSWSGESNQPGARFGCSVASAGDVNGDGYSDVIVTAAFYDNGQTDEGRVYVYYGSANGLSDSANWTAETNQNFAYLYSAACAGDVNGDGYSDVIVGSQNYDNGQTDEGRVFVYFGSAAGLSLTPNWSAESNQSGAHFGVSVSSAGDVNGDGYSDVMIGAQTYNGGQSGEGKVFVYYGSSKGPPQNPDWTAEGDQTDAQFGISVSNAGDVNGDGYSDVIIGAWLYDNGESDEGRAFVYSGSPSGLSNVATWTAESNQPGAEFGFSVSGAGDVNGDGFSDVIIGSFLYDNNQADEGRAFVYYGSQNGLSNTAGWTAESDQINARFGVSVSSAGDIDGDGFSDVIIGSYRYDNGETDEGRVYVYRGSPSGLSGVADWTAESNQPGALFGYWVSTAGDINGNSISDIIIGSINYDNGQTDEGKAFVYNGIGISNLKTLKLTLLIQGFYRNPNDIMIRDSIKVYLRNADSPYAIADSSKAYLNNSGKAVLLFRHTLNGVSYYLEVKHRNSIETWSSVPITFINSGADFDFSGSSSQAFGNNELQLSSTLSKFGFFSGDVDQDGIIDLSDIILIYNDAVNFASGYVRTDINGDYNTDLTDILVAYNNSINFIAKIIPQ